MSLLVDLSTEALDPGYAAAAARRAARADAQGESGGPAQAAGSGALLGAAVLAATLLVVIAAVQTRASAPAAARSRAALTAQVQRQSTLVSGLERELTTLRSQQAALRDASLLSTSEGARLSRRLAEEELAVGTVAVTGPGLRVTLADAASNGDRNRVLDTDLQAVVNALWGAGAEAIAINGARLSTGSAIRMAGDAVLVDFRPLVSPYTVSAVGDPVALETGFGTSKAAARLHGYAQLYGLRFAYARAGRLTLPAAPDAALRYARPTAVPPSRGPS